MDAPLTSGALYEDPPLPTFKTVFPLTMLVSNEKYITSNDVVDILVGKFVGKEEGFNDGTTDGNVLGEEVGPANNKK